MLSWLVVGLLVHVPLLWIAFDFYMTSVVLDGMQHFSFASSHTPAKRLVLIVVDDLGPDFLFNPKSFPDRPRPQDDEHTPNEGLGLATIITGTAVPFVRKGWVDEPVDSLLGRAHRTYAFGTSTILSMFAGSTPEGKVKEWRRWKTEDFAEGIDASVLDWAAFEEMKMLFTNATSDPKLNAELTEDKTLILLTLRGLNTTAALDEATVTKNIMVMDKIVQETESLVRNFYNEKEGEEETTYIFTASCGTSPKNYWDGRKDDTRTPLVMWGKGVRGPQSAIADDIHSSQWGLEGLLRRDILQSDLSPLIATLLGTEWPAHSIGTLPGIVHHSNSYQEPDKLENVENGFVLFDEEDIARAAEVNAKVMLEQLRVQEAISRFRKAFALMSFSPVTLPMFTSYLTDVNTLIRQRHFTQARKKASVLIQLVSESIRHVETFNETVSQVEANLLHVVPQTRPLNIVQRLINRSMKTKLTEKAARWALASAIFAAISLMVWLQQASWKYVASVTWPFCFWVEVAEVSVTCLLSSGLRAQGSIETLGMIEDVLQPATKQRKDDEFREQLHHVINWISGQVALIEERKVREERWEQNLEYLRESIYPVEGGDMIHAIHEKLDSRQRIQDEISKEKSQKRTEKAAYAMQTRETVGELYKSFQEFLERWEDDVRRYRDKGKGREEADGGAIVNELTRQNQELRELLQSVSDGECHVSATIWLLVVITGPNPVPAWREDCERRHIDTINAVRETAHEQVPFNIQGYLDEFSKALASEVRMLLGEVGKLREERHGLLHEIGYLFCVRSKYRPGGEFEPDWKPTPGMPGGPPAEGPSTPEILQAFPGWRHVTQRTKKKKKEAAPQPPRPGEPMHGVPLPPGMDPRRQVQSWATWQPDPGLRPTPSSVERFFSFRTEVVLEWMPSSFPRKEDPKSEKPTVPLPQSSEPKLAKSGWVHVSRRRNRTKKSSLPPHPPPPPPPGTLDAKRLQKETGVDPIARSQGASWAAWQPDPGLQPSVDPTILVPAGLFGPRSPELAPNPKPSGSRDWRR
ncbi:hypothetical protein D9758_012051 [Tetrapyrgos nigripes]|uniref:GPI ethanolamine phosphate transferase 1 n=1 Tax=Tetrapyrgos nigripes TaxID=182062 RepID=A0A8H5FIV3_9AGAR|nr:hypothetical protein D9758_012051 [Tetrapyrgos nigripes]